MSHYYCLAMAPQGAYNQRAIGKGSGETEDEAVSACWRSTAVGRYFDVIFCAREEYLAGRLLPPPAELEEIKGMLPLGSTRMCGDTLVWELGGHYPPQGFRVQGWDDHRELVAGRVGPAPHQVKDLKDLRHMYWPRRLVTAESLRSFIEEHSSAWMPV